MKKLFIVLAVASLGFVACNSDADKTPAADTPAVKIDTPAPMVPDTSKMTTPDTSKMKADTSKMK